MFTDRQKYRLLEMIPGTITWATFIGAVVFSFIKPLWVIYFVILFDLYWLFRVLYFVFYLIISWRRYKRDTSIAWSEKIQTMPESASLYHIVFLPVYQEGIQVIKTTFDSLLAAKYDHWKMIIVLGFEARKKDNYDYAAPIIQKEYGDKFYQLLITLHPGDLPDEVAGKGANANWMGHRAKEYIDTTGISYDKLIVSYFDIDTCTHREYFSYLSYKFLTVPNHLRKSYQPVALFNNNIWQANPITRVAAFGTTFWLLTELARPERLYTFSSHSMSWQTLVDVGFWQKDIITDDSRIFLQGFFRYDGDYQVEPMYIPVSMDTVDAGKIWPSIKILYKQQRRWAWGIEHFPYLIWNFRTHKIKFSQKFYYTWNILEGMCSWATAPILIFVLGRLPMWVVSGTDEAFLLTQNAPFVLQKIMFLAMLGILLSILVSLLLLPSRPETRPRRQWLVMISQWLLLPVTLIFFGSIPAIESQTRLMFGWYLGFFNTPKKRD